MKESTTTLIVRRNGLEKIRPDKYNDFEKPINELKNAGAQVKENGKA